MDEDAPYSEDEDDAEKTHGWGPPLSHSTYILVDTMIPLNVPRLADKSTEAGGGSFIATEYEQDPHPSSYYHNISRLHSSLWTLIVNGKTSLYPPHSFVYCVFLHQSAHFSRGGWWG